eukprot:1793109-Pyramimonas_sp.AAC.1
MLPVRGRSHDPRVLALLVVCAGSFRAVTVSVRLVGRRFPQAPAGTADDPAGPPRRSATTGGGR